MTWMGIVSVLVRSAELRTLASFSAFSGESFSPAISVYSKEILLFVLVKYSLQAASSSSTHQLLFTGMIFALQLGLELRRLNQEIYLGAAVMVTLIREMGPFSCGMCLAACVGSAIAAELGTMKVNDEIAALEIMSISPIRFLAAPRILALMLMAPLLGFFCCVIGTIGGGVVGVTQLGVDFRQYMASALAIAGTKDLFVGLLKALVFGTVIGTVSVAEGFGTSRGATGVGRSTQRSVIVSFLLILMLGYMVTRMCYR